MAEARRGPRPPGTVVVLVGLQALGLAWFLARRDDAWASTTVVWVPLTLWFFVALWQGYRWVYTLLLGCLLFGVVIIVPAAIFIGGLEAPQIAWSLASAGVYLVLLMHPATRRHAGDQPDDVQRQPESLAAWVRRALAHGLGAVFVTLVVGVPIVWATGWVEGRSLIALLAALVAVGAGVSLLARARRAP